MSRTDGASDAALTLWLDPQGKVLTLDQTCLPFEKRVLELDSLASCIHAIKVMQVRGAPLIGAVAAFGYALGLREMGAQAPLLARVEMARALLASRPTAVNLRWAVDRMNALCDRIAPAHWAARAWQLACDIAALDAKVNAAIGRHGAQAFAALKPRQDVLQVLTHCNAGRLATVAHGTALAPVYQWHREGRPVHVWVDETRPRNQGASLTAWELREAGVPFTVIADNAGGLLMMQDRVDVVIVGCDRVAANGDVANKVGTYLKALAARAHGIPFYVACPLSTVDLRAGTGSEIPIEYRDGRELHTVSGRSAQGTMVDVEIFPKDFPSLNPAFDVTPATMLSAYITEKGLADALQLRHWARNTHD